MSLSPQVVLGKSATDDELLEALRAEVARLRAQMKAAAAAATAERETNGGGRASQGSSGGAPNSDALLRSEIQRLERLCRNQVRSLVAAAAAGARSHFQQHNALPAAQADQIESQDKTLRHLKQRLQT